MGHHAPHDTAMLGPSRHVDPSIVQERAEALESAEESCSVDTDTASEGEGAGSCTVASDG